jgi:RNA 2',3'-cyclic 3'-phosphodiesterase
VRSASAEQAEPRTWRLFIAIPLPEPVKDAIEQAQAELRRALPDAGVRWTKREQFHLTLKFLGDVEAARVDSLKGSLSRACEKFAALPLRVERVGFFPQARSPRVIWVGVNDSGGMLQRLQGGVEMATAEFTQEKPEGQFAGHITLGRIKAITRLQADTLAKVALGMKDRRFGEWTADQVELIRSELASGGARYTTLAAVPLRV